MLPLTHKHLWLTASALLVVLVVYGSLSPAAALPVPGGVDKVEHFAAYLFLAVWFTALYPRTSYWRVVAGLLGLGLALEVLQHLMQLGRSAELPDMVANAAGVLLGYGLAVAATGDWAMKVDSWLNRS